MLPMLAGMAGTIGVVATGGHPACPGGPAREVSERWSDSFLPSDRAAYWYSYQRSIKVHGQPATALYSPSTSPPLELEEGRWRGSRAAAAAGGAHCGFRRYMQETSVLTLLIKFGHSLNS